jgi:hypothetical protein
MLDVRFAAVLGLVVLAVLAGTNGGCGDAHCTNSCLDDQPAVFDLSCGPADLTGVDLFGPCAIGDASVGHDTSGPGSAFVAVSSTGEGVCQVKLTFASGFAYVASVSFGTRTDPGPSGCGCPSYTAPTQSTFVVSRPNTTCVDAGTDGPASD